MYLVDTDVISEARKGARANPGVRRFFAELSKSDAPVYLSVVTIGELRRGTEAIRHRGNQKQAVRLESWLDNLLAEYEEQILEFGAEEAHLWGRLRVPHPENAIDKQIAATALARGLVLVTRNSPHFAGLGVEVLNPFS